MKTIVYLCVKKSEHRFDPTFRVTKTKPNLDHNEIAVKIDLELPYALFTKPTLEAKVVVSEKAVAPTVIEADVVNNVEQIIREQTGFTVKLSVVAEEE
jgi:hypothetical protein